MSRLKSRHVGIVGILEFTIGDDDVIADAGGDDTLRGNNGNDQLSGDAGETLCAAPAVPSNAAGAGVVRNVRPPLRGQKARNAFGQAN